MKKIYYIIILIASLFILSSCKEEKIEIVNMAQTEDGYYKELIDNSINLKDYVNTTNSFNVSFEGASYSSNDELTFTLNEGANVFIITFGDNSYKLTFYLLQDYKVVFIYNGNEIASIVTKENSSLNPFDIKFDDEGWEWNGDVINLDTYETINYKDIVVTSDLTLEVIATPLTYQVMVDGKAYEIKTNELINFPEGIKEGYEFICFNDDIQNGMRYNPSMGLTFESKFAPCVYTITFIQNGNTTILKCLYNGSIDFPSVELAGYEFVGWYYNDLPFNESVYLYTTDITLVGKYTPLTYKLTFTNIDNEYSIDVLYQSTFELPVPKKDGFKFLYWEVNGTKVSSNVYSYLENVEFKAVFEEISFKKVSLNLEAFGGDVDNEALVDSSGNITLPVPVKEGYNFKYWSKNSHLTEPITTLSESEYNNELLYACYELNDRNLIGELVVTMYNAHASRYDELAMFDGSKSGFTSKYWHKVGIKKSDDGYFVSAIAISGAALSSLGDYDFVILGYTDYALYTEFVNMGYLVGYKVYFTVDPATLTSGSNTIQVSFVEPSIDEDIDLIKEELESIYGEYETISSDIELVTNVKNYSITWKTSNKNAISSAGKYIKPYVTRTVTLSAYVGSTFVYSFDVLVHGEHEESKALSTGYIYTPYTITQNAMDVLDIIYCAFLDINENGDFTNETRMKNNIKNYILPKAKVSGTKVVISVNQNASGAFSKVSGSKELREKLARNILIFIEELGLDGIDIDWETPSSSEATNFTLLMKEIYEVVKAKNPDYLVTAAIGGGMWAPPKYDLPNSKNYMDYINLMTYSMASGSGYYQNSLYKSTKGATLVSCSIEESIKIYNDLGVKNSQILVGIPFYTTVQTNSLGPGSKTGDGKSVWYDKMLSTYPLSDTMIEYFDEECGVPYRYDATKKVFISYDNERSIMVKCDYINTLGLAGIMYWQYGQDVDDMLSNAIHKYINK